MVWCWAADSHFTLPRMSKDLLICWSAVSPSVAKLKGSFILTTAASSQGCTLRSNTTTWRIRHYGIINTLQQTNDISKVVDCPPLTLIHKLIWIRLTNSKIDAREKYSRSPIVFSGCASAFKAYMPLETLPTTNCFVTVSLPKHGQYFCSRLPRPTSS